MVDDLEEPELLAGLDNEVLGVGLREVDDWDLVVLRGQAGVGAEDARGEVVDCCRFGQDNHCCSSV